MPQGSLHVWMGRPLDAAIVLMGTQALIEQLFLEEPQDATATVDSTYLPA
jgi:hypothetical protein